MFNSSSARRHVLLAVVTLMGVGCYAGSDDGGGGAQPGLGKDDGLQAVEQTQRALATNDPWIGVVPSGDPATAPCAQGWAGIRMDDEDSSNANTFNFYNNSFGSVHMSGHNFSAGGLIHSASPGRAGGNTWLRYCPTQVNKLYPLRYDYAVISASNVCPTGSYSFSSRFDNEDIKNHNRF